MYIKDPLNGKTPGNADDLINATMPYRSSTQEPNKLNAIISEPAVYLELP